MSAPRFPHRHAELSELADHLRCRARKLTGPRQAILGALRRQARPLTNKEVRDALPKGDCDLATVYRSMHLLEEMGLVKRFDFGDGVARFKLLRPGDDGHQHHLVCTGCSKVVEVEECAISELEQRLATRNGFKAVTHRLEFFGLCPACQ